MSLPNGYTRLEYIRSSGTQYIDTMFKANNNTRVVMDAELIGTGTVCLFGARTSATSKNYAVLSLSTYIRSDYNTAYSQQFSVNVNTRRIYDKNKETTVIDGTSKSYTNATFQADWNMFLFANNDNGSAKYQSSAKVYSCQIYDNGTLIRDYLPSKNAAGVIGLWDDVGGKFYTNAGSGTFSAGPELIPPDAPTAFFQSLNVTLKWAAVNCVGYRIYRNNTLLTETADTIFIDESVVSGTDYTYKLVAFNDYYESAPVTLSVSVREGYSVVRPVIQSAFFQ